MKSDLHLAPNWRTILRRAWSIRLILLAGLLTGIEAVLPFIAPDALPPGVLPALTLVVIASAFVARLIAQKGLT
jgi:hypothetical protein